jgi:GTP-binding protein
LRDLQFFRRASQHRARRGGNGEGALRHGADGDTLVLRVPPGTEVSGEEDGDLAGRRWDLTAPGRRVVVAGGGSGGRGNKRFATATRQAPRFAERGLPGEAGWLSLSLKLLADVGLIGLPNAGKSSLLARITRAAPKIGDYPFTTLEPVLGTLENDDRQLVIADVPGLIEGAADGAGLGHDFLAHVQRTRVLAHVLALAGPLDDGSGADDETTVEDWRTVERELEAYDAHLARLPRVMVLSKADLVTADAAQAAVARWRERLAPDVPVLATSSATGAGLAELRRLLLEYVPLAELPAATEGDEQLADHLVFRPAARRGFTVSRTGPSSFAVRGEGVERLLRRHDTGNDEAMSYVEHRLRRMGVLRALEAEGFESGDEVEISGTVFELDAAPDGS